MLPGVPYPPYRLLIIAAGVAVAVLLYGLVGRTRVGMLVRAGATTGRWCGRSACTIRCCTRWCSRSAPRWRGWRGR